MGRSVDASRQQEVDKDGREWTTISFAQRHVNSEAFKTLFKEGMGLVESAAAYLDGPGRAQSKSLPRQIALAYAAESMRLTTRLMQIASWLLLRRAVNEGELTQAQAMSERRRVRLTRQELSSAEDQLAQLPREFVELCEQSLRLQARVLHLDHSISNAPAMPASANPGPVAAQVALLEQALARGDLHRPA